MYTAQILNQHFQLDRQEHWLAQGTPFDGTVHPSGRPPAMGKNLEGVSHRHRRLLSLGLEVTTASTTLSLSTWLQKEDI